MWCGLVICTLRQPLPAQLSTWKQSCGSIGVDQKIVFGMFLEDRIGLILWSEHVCVCLCEIANKKGALHNIKDETCKYPRKSAYRLERLV